MEDVLEGEEGKIWLVGFLHGVISEWEEEREMCGLEIFFICFFFLFKVKTNKSTKQLTNGLKTLSVSLFKYVKVNLLSKNFFF